MGRIVVAMHAMALGSMVAVSIQLRRTSAESDGGGTGLPALRDGAAARAPSSFFRLAGGTYHDLVGTLFGACQNLARIVGTGQLRSTPEIY
jgi:hypothetical protein